MPNYLSLVAPEITVKTMAGAASNDKVGIMGLLPDT